MSSLRILPRSAREPARALLAEVVLESRALSVRIDGVPILDRIDLQLHAGEVLALVGPNGAGKSTLLSALAGDVTPSTGEVRLRDRPLAQWSTTELAMRRAVLLQQVTVSFPFTVREVVQMGRAPWGKTAYADLDDTVVLHALAATDVSALADRRFNTLSGGERARVALARVLAQRTGVLLLDEPTAALDLHHQELVMAIVRQRAAEGDATVVVLHDLNLAAAHADRIAVLDEGRIVVSGHPRDVVDADTLSTVYNHPIEVFPHPESGLPLVIPRRG